MFEEIIEKELIFVRKYIKDIPLPLLTAFYKEFEGRSEDEVRVRQNEIFEMYSLSLSANALAIELAINQMAEIIFKPESYSVTPHGDVYFMTRGGAILTTKVDALGESRKEIENVISNWMYAVVEKPKRKMHPYQRNLIAKITEIEPLLTNYDYESAKRVLNDYGLKPVEALLLAFGVIPCKETIRLYLPRLISLFYYNGMPVHTIQLTNTDSGKSYFGIRCEFAFNFTSFSEFPSPAKLIYDARNASKGAVFVSNGIVIDEIDKLNKQRFEESYQPLNTGLENGIWRRGVQTISGINLEGYRLIPFILFGNILQGEDPLYLITENPRNTVTSLLDNATGMSTYSFVERFAIVDVIYKRIPILDYVIKKDGVYGSMRDSVLRALILLIQERIKIQEIDGYGIVNGRLRRHAEAVYNIVSALFGEEVEFDDKDVCKLVAGELTVEELLNKVFKEKEQSIPEVEVIDFTKMNTWV